MITSGLPLVQSLSVLAEQTENERFKVVIAAVLNDIQAGQTLADAMRRHPKVFTDLYVNMIAAGEAGGILDTILLRLATFLEENPREAKRIVEKFGAAARFTSEVSMLATEAPRSRRRSEPNTALTGALHPVTMLRRCAGRQRTDSPRQNSLGASRKAALVALRLFSVAGKRTHSVPAMPNV